MTIRVQRPAEEQLSTQAKQLEQAVARDIRAAQADARLAQADARQAAQDAREAASQLNNEGASITTTVTSKGLTKTITYPDGRGGYSKIVIDHNGVQMGGERITTSAGSSGQRDIPPNVMELLKDVSIAACLIVIGVPLVRGFWRFVERRGSTPNVQPEVLQRLSAIENAVESIAVEVERVSEGQRFTTRLLSERQQAPVEDFVVSGGHARMERPRG